MKKIIALLCTFGFIAVGCQSKKENTEKNDTAMVQNNTFSTVTLNKLFVDELGNNISFQNILAKHKGSPVVVEIWASWCSDCIKGFPELKKLQAKYPKTAFVFLSLDKTKEKWTEAVKKFQLEGNHYYLNEKMNGEFGKSIDLDWIPRYIVVDAQGKIALKKAIVANDTLLIKTLDNLQL